VILIRTIKGSEWAVAPAITKGAMTSVKPGITSITLAKQKDP
jgi:hypothetical protein